VLGCYREGQINVLDPVQNKAAKFAHHMSDSSWETLTRCRKIARICAVLRAYTGEQAWKATGDRLQRPCCLGRVNHEKKIRSRKQRTDIGKYSFVNSAIRHWNQLPADDLGIFFCKPNDFRKRVRKVINQVK
jgi:hypothetical protein